MPGVHPTHETRISDASSFDEICKNCGETDGIGTFGKLVDPCVAAPAVAAKLEDAKTAVSKRHAKDDSIRIYGEPRPTYFVFRNGANAPSHRHQSRVKASIEANRLSRKNPGVIFHVVKLKESYMTPGDPRIGLQVVFHNDPILHFYGYKGLITDIFHDEHVGTLATVAIDVDGEVQKHNFFPNQFEIMNTDADGDPIRQFDRVEIADLVMRKCEEPVHAKGRVLYVADELALVQIGNQRPVEFHPSRLRKLGKASVEKGSIGDISDPSVWLVGDAA